MSNFSCKYENTVSIIFEEITSFQTYFENSFLTSDTPITTVLSDYFSKKGKRIRPVLIFLLVKALGFSADESIYKLAFADEMIHNATLMHDDIIDSSPTRHGKTTINQAYDSKLAVLAGDYLLSLALKALSSFENSEIIKIHTDSISNIINGEISQYFEREKLLSIEEYIEKSKNKTAELFKAGLVSAAVICETETENIKNIENFALNFGTAFQIHNDLADAIEENGGEDFKNATYTAPWIYYFAENHDVKTKMLKNTSAVHKTQDLIDSYISRAIENINFLGDNQFKQGIINLCNLFKGQKSANR